MIKFASITFTIMLMGWIRFGLQDGENVHPSNILAAGTFLWFAVFGSWIAWMLLLIMVRQLGSALRGK